MTLLKKMNPNRFVVGERVDYVNHVTGEALGMLVVESLSDQFVFAKRFFSRKVYTFDHAGRATWSSNLSIKHQPMTPHPSQPEGEAK